MKVEPYLLFNGRCEEALNFYRTALGAEITGLMRFKENPEPMAGPNGCAPPPGTEEKILHASFRIGETTVMASDGMASGNAEFKGISLTITVPTDAEAERLFKALSAGGQVQMAIGKTFYATAFGMVVDRFGVSWMVINPLPMP
ncbi:VOC family protein [Polaromonas sp.]|uniref:VOC family protein n=1 Tax=Polaromonas sp. TaxID=1869339 RepID=UPI003CA20868